MRLNRHLPERADPEHVRDPRDPKGAEIIDLATRSVLPAVTQRKPGREGAGAFAGIVVVGMLGAATLWTMDSARQAPLPAQVGPAKGAATATGPAAPVIPVVPPQAVTNIPAPAPAPALAAAPQAAPAVAPAANPAASPTIVFDVGAMPGTPTSQIAAPAAGTMASTGNGNEDFAGRIGGVGGSAAVAAASFAPGTTVTQGTLIPAVLETAIDTDVPGFVRAVVSGDVRSFDGSRVLVPRSSRLIGQYRSGLQAGQKRAYVIWTRLIRPDGVSVNIGSPAVGFSGETGLAGKVNTHFFERFGSAMLLSVIGGLSAIGGNAGVVIAGGGQSAAAAAVGQSGQIGPTVRVRQGQPIRVFTARDLDFSKVASQ